MTSYFAPGFLAAFLPACVLLYAVVPRKVRPAILLAFSYLFVWAISNWLIVFLLLSTLIVYFVGRGMGVMLAQRDEQLAQVKKGKREIKNRCKQKMKGVLVVGIVANFGILVALKYLGFFSQVATSLLSLLGLQVTLVAPRIGITIGISFYTLMAVSYLLDVYRESVQADRNLARVALFLSFFPQIMEGPICRYSQTVPGLWAGEPINERNLSYGSVRIAVGIVKKFIIADRLNLYVEAVFNNYAAFDGGVIALAAILYTIQLYCDFSGCMDVAIGVGRIFNVQIPENFKQPFLSRTASEFWQRWHITLGTWFKDYVYYPVSLSKPVKNLTSKARKKFGNRYGPLMTSSIALFCVWLGNGLWHGAGSQYVFFGMYYFVLIVAGGFIEPSAQALAARFGWNRESTPYKTFRIARTLVVIFIGELFFRANGLQAGLEMFGQIVGNFSLDTFTSGALFDGSIVEFRMNTANRAMDAADFAIAAVFTALVFAAGFAREKGHNPIEWVCGKGIPVRIAALVLMLFAIVIFGAYGSGFAPVDPMYAQF